MTLQLPCVSTKYQIILTIMKQTNKAGSGHQLDARISSSYGSPDGLLPVVFEDLKHQNLVLVVITDGVQRLPQSLVDNDSECY